MKTLFSLTITIAGLKVADPEDTVAPKVNLDNFQLDLKHEVDMEPAEYTAAVNSIGKMLTTCIYDLAKPSAQVGKEPHLIMDDTPDVHDCTHETYHPDCGFCRARHSRHICMKCHTNKAESFSTICTECQKGGGN